MPIRVIGRGPGFPWAHARLTIASPFCGYCLPRERVRAVIVLSVSGECLASIDGRVALWRSLSVRAYLLSGDMAFVAT